MKRPSTLLLALALSFSALACGRSAPPDSSADGGESQAPKPVEKTLSTFNPIQGTDYHMAGIVPVEVTRESSN
ncbi:MAG: hypothetical protein DCC59_06890, partial [Chloroflexi bacterium]